MKIDTHQHFWAYTSEEYGWLTESMAVLRKNYLPQDLAVLLRAQGIGGTVSVQARQTLEESRWLLHLADENPFILGVVGWVDLRSRRLPEQLQEFSRHPKFRGVRHIIQDEPDDRFMLREDFVRGISQLGEFGLTYDLLVYPRQLPAAYELVQRFPEQLFVLDHIAKPTIKDHQLEPWARDLKRLARFANVFCKVSGLVTEADWKDWKPADFSPYLDVVFEAFGEKRIMLGSDWPVCTPAASYAAVFDIASNYIQQLSSDEQAAIWNVNPRFFYGLDA